MRFLVVTPSCNQLQYLKLCVSSVADQFDQNIEVHHHIQDALSTDGTVEWLNEKIVQYNEKSKHYTFTFASEKDVGMYDAISKGWKFLLDRTITDKLETKKSNTFVAWLNCDEQYLEGALNKVSDWYKKNPKLDSLFGSVLIVQPSGKLECSRVPVKPFRYHVMTAQLPLYSAAMFINANAILKYDLYPDSKWKDVGDAALFLKMMNSGVKYGIIRNHISSFTESGENRALSHTAKSEMKLFSSQYPKWINKLKFIWIILHRLKKLVYGAYNKNNISYSIYTQLSKSKREHFKENNAQTKWLSRIDNIK